MTAHPQFQLDWQWRAAPEIGAPELAATWAELRMSVGTHIITMVQEAGTSTFRTHTVCALYPMAEWIAFNWWSLVADARPGSQISQLRFAYHNGVGDARGSWWVRSRRHILRAACDGFHWPDVLFLPEGRETRIVWTPDMGPDIRPGNRFTSQGNILVRSESFAETLAGFVDAVTARLAGQGVAGTPMQQEWAAVRAADDEETAFCLAAARLGLDPYAEAGPYGADIITAGKQLAEPFATDFFNAVSPDRIADQLRWLARARERAGAAAGHAPPDPALAELRAACADLSERFYATGKLEQPWRLGYEVAQRVRAWAGLDDTAAFEPASLLTYHTEQVPYTDRGLVAFGSRTGKDGATVVSSRRFTERPRRFLQARVLWHLICDVDEDFLVTAAHTDRQAVERGFALEVLAPAKGIATLLAAPAGLVSVEDVEQIAEDYGVSTIIVEHQLDLQVLAMDFAWSDEVKSAGSNARTPTGRVLIT